jgi:hypothetical protein
VVTKYFELVFSGSIETRSVKPRQTADNNPAYKIYLHNEVQCLGHVYYLRNLSHIYIYYIYIYTHKSVFWELLSSELLRCATTQKSAVLIYLVAEAYSLAYLYLNAGSKLRFHIAAP